MATFSICNIRACHDMMTKHTTKFTYLILPVYFTSFTEKLITWLQSLEYHIGQQNTTIQWLVFLLYIWVSQCSNFSLDRLL